MDIKLALVVESDSHLFLQCDEYAGGELIPVAVEEGKPVRKPGLPVLLDGSAPAPLGRGLYMLRSRRGVVCKVLDGDVTVIVVTGGEDPWPMPPPELLAELADYPGAMQYFVRNV